MTAKSCLMTAATLLAASVSLPGVAHAGDDQTPPPEPVPVAAPAVWTGPLADLESANPQIGNPNLILPGQVITLPGGDDYTVRRGDTLADIAGGKDAPAPLIAPETPPEAASQAETPEAPEGAPVHHSGVNWDAVAACESGGNWAINTGNGFEGGVQFLNSTWLSVKAPEDPPHAYQASKDQQMSAAERLLHRSGIGQWPVCGRRG